MAHLKNNVRYLIHRCKNPFFVFCYLSKHLKNFFVRKKITHNSCYNFNKKNSFYSKIDVFHPIFNKELSQIEDCFHSGRLNKRINSNVRNNIITIFDHEFLFYSSETGHYKWNVDYETGTVIENVEFFKIKIKDDSAYDIKNIWEIGRMQFLNDLAISYIENHDVYLIELYKKIVKDFFDFCPLFYGPQWMNSMEVGIRIFNINLSFSMLYKQFYDDKDFIKLIAEMNRQHYFYIKTFPEKTFNHANNHYLADLLGILTYFASIKRLSMLKKCARKIDKQIARQFFEDGMHFECSLSYLNLVLEILGCSLAILDENNIHLSKTAINKLTKSIDFAKLISNNNYQYPLLGDNDSGSVTGQIKYWHTNSFYFSLRLLSLIIKHQTISNSNNYIHDCNNSFSKSSDLLHLMIFHKSGIAIAYNSKYKMIIRLNYPKNSFLSHAHSDIGSFLLSVRNKPFIIDPGSFRYTKNADLRDYSKGINSHSCVNVDNKNQFSSISSFSNFKIIKTSNSATHNTLSLHCFEAEIEYVRTFSFYESYIIIEDKKIKGNTMSTSMLFPEELNVVANNLNEFTIGKEMVVRSFTSITHKSSPYFPCYGSQKHGTSLECKTDSNYNNISLEVL